MRATLVGSLVLAAGLNAALAAPNTAKVTASEASPDIITVKLSKTAPSDTTGSSKVDFVWSQTTPPARDAGCSQPQYPFSGSNLNECYAAVCGVYLTPPVALFTDGSCGCMTKCVKRPVAQRVVAVRSSCDAVTNRAMDPRLCAQPGRAIGNGPDSLVTLPLPLQQRLLLLVDNELVRNQLPAPRVLWCGWLQRRQGDLRCRRNDAPGHVQQDADYLVWVPWAGAWGAVEHVNVRRGSLGSRPLPPLPPWCLPEPVRDNRRSVHLLDVQQ